MCGIYGHLVYVRLQGHLAQALPVLAELMACVEHAGEVIAAGDEDQLVALDSGALHPDHHVAEVASLPQTPQLDTHPFSVLLLGIWLWRGCVLWAARLTSFKSLPAGHWNSLLGVTLNFSKHCSFLRGNDVKGFLSSDY